MGKTELNVDVWEKGTQLMKIFTTEDGDLLAMELVIVAGIDKIHVEKDYKEFSIDYLVQNINKYEDEGEFVVNADRLITLDEFINRYKGQMLRNVWTNREYVDIWMCRDSDDEDTEEIGNPRPKSVRVKHGTEMKEDN